MRWESSRWLAVWGACFAALLLGWTPAARHVRAAQFLQRLSEPAPSAAAQPARITTEDVTISGGSGPIRARLYFRADQPRGPGVVVAHGVHYRGIDERRLVPFARALAE